MVHNFSSKLCLTEYKDKQLITFSVAVDSRLSFMFCMILLTRGAVIACYVLGGWQDELGL